MLLATPTYCASRSAYARRKTREVAIGNVVVGGDQPIRVQSMTTTRTQDIEATLAQTIRLVDAGCEIVRITAPTVTDAKAIGEIRRRLIQKGIDVPLVADIHFSPAAAMEAAEHVDKVRVNPGNFADQKFFRVREYTDEDYAAEIARIDERFTPLVLKCQQRGVAMRIGSNHGSLSDRIMNRYGDTPAGMVESALEFVRIARKHDYHDIVLSMKASNPKVMIQAYRLLVAKMDEEGLDPYPLHLGVTEAGDGEDGRIKSAIGIGSLLNDGIGDTIRVSLTEDSVHEIPVAQALASSITAKTGEHPDLPTAPLSYDPFTYRRRAAERLVVSGVPLGGEETIRVFTSQAKWDALAHKLDKLGDYRPEAVVETSGVLEVDPRDDHAIAALQHSSTRFVTVADGLDLPVIAAFRLLAAHIPERHPILLKDTLTPATDAGADFQKTLITAAKRIGSLLCDGIGDAVLVQGGMLGLGADHATLGPGQSLRLAYNILQAAGARIFKTDYVACPSCGRTLFDLQTTTARIKEATSHLKGVKIAIMGCIVNGPGEMADADFGYVGGAPGKVNLYVGKSAVKFNIPEKDAVERLKDLIREHGKWTEAREAAGQVP